MPGRTEPDFPPDYDDGGVEDVEIDRLPGDEDDFDDDFDFFDSVADDMPDDFDDDYRPDR
jgi:hypothetical protein